MGSWDEATIQRLINDGRADELRRLLAPPGSSSACLVLKTKKVATYPTAALASYGVQLCKLSGAELEGVAPTIEAVGKVFQATNVGASAPKEGTLVVGDHTGGRWVFQFDGSST